MYKGPEVRVCQVCLKSLKEVMWPIGDEGGDLGCWGWGRWRRVQDRPYRAFSQSEELPLRNLSEMEF